ncbi:NlpC/P60 family protein [Maribacter chungangensis]|uniref:NlpC/P60 family protein n=1 Tax=Maribacter chungangensis TaxID=1069117 RepID=A0ABW3B307_9FLAO
MQYGICPISIVPVRALPEEASEMVTQLLFGEHFKVLESRKRWSKIRVAFDKREGWVLNTQLDFITRDEYDQIQHAPKNYASELISYVERQSSMLVPVLIGSCINEKLSQVKFEGNLISSRQVKDNLIKIALLYLNAPELWGGKTPFGIDASGFTQMVYKINGYHLLRSAQEQANQGIPLSFVEESEAGDLAFFDNSNGIIDHVGIIMDNNYIIHVNGVVRIDRLDHTGIFNNDQRNYTHKLRVIKKVI